MKKQRKKRTAFTVILDILIVVFAGVLLWSLWNIAKVQLEYRGAVKEYEKYQQAAPFDPTALQNSETEAEEEPSLSAIRAQLTELMAANSDLIGRIVIPGTNIDYPMVQGSDNAWYLNHTFEGNFNSSGAIFLDYLCDPSFNGLNTIIYGHNMHNGSMFENLNLLLNAATLAQYDRVWLLLPDEILEYTIFSARVTTIEDSCYTISTSDEASWLAGLPGSAAAGLSPGGKLLTLSTCTYELESDDRVIVQAVRTASHPWPE